MVVALISISLLLFLALVIFMYKESKSLEVTEETIHLPVKIKNTDILFLSDIHRRVITEKDIPHFSKADYVIIGGDLVEKGVPTTQVKHNLSILSEFGKIIFVWGNNDYKFGEERLIQLLLTDHKIISLKNSSIRIGMGDYTWMIAGVDDFGTERADINKTLGASDCPVLLISHNPSIVPLLEHNKQRISAVLAGHTHGGQIRFGPIGIAEKGGWKQRNGISLFISNGFGTRKFPLRLGAKPQIHLIKVIGTAFKGGT
ncbi:MAG: metallophosphoesterase family protein [Bacillus sp. (in: Bacteria)]|nr:metallophosphoesterase family protein [Bacillus sp. (in: firmicutes)]